MSVAEATDFVSFLRKTNGKYELNTFGRYARTRIDSFDDVKYMTVDQYLNQHEKDRLQIFGDNFYIKKGTTIDTAFQEIRSLLISQLRLIETYPESLAYWKQEYVQSKRFSSEEEFLKNNPKPIFPKFSIKYQDNKIDLSFLDGNISPDMINGANIHISLFLTIACEKAIQSFDDSFLNGFRMSPVTLDDLEKDLIKHENESEILNKAINDYNSFKESK